MFCQNDSMCNFLCPGKMDMRKGINSLCGVVHDRMRYDVRFGNVFIFINRSRTTMKLLHAEDGGMGLYVKRLEEGHSGCRPMTVKADLILWNGEIWF